MWELKVCYIGRQREDIDDKVECAVGRKADLELEDGTNRILRWKFLRSQGAEYAKERVAELRIVGIEMEVVPCQQPHV